LLVKKNCTLEDWEQLYDPETEKLAEEVENRNEG
jgi:suppressor of G2 allele of SKP1